MNTYTLYMYIGPDEQNILAYNWDYFLIHQFKHIFLVFKRATSLSYFEYPRHMFCLRFEKINF